MSTAKISVNAIKAFSDNYIWSISSSETNEIALVDPGDAKTCIDYLEKNNAKLSAILITHHHSDHVGGINQLVKYCQQHAWPLTVFGPANESIPHCDITLVENDMVELPALNLQLKVIDLPGHTAGHIAYANDELLFCGDTLFSAGCGRLFEGTAQQMYLSLNKLAALPDHIKVYCAHEYTEANLNFALTVDPENFELINYFNQVQMIRSQQQATIPTTIGLEKQVNPFLRCQENALQQSAQDYSNNPIALGVETFTVMREWKNQF